MAAQASQVAVPPEAQRILTRLQRATKTSQQLVERIRIVLLSADGWNNRKVARELGVDRQRVRRWRNRWRVEEPRVIDAVGVGATDADLEALIRDILSDNRRCGGPAKFSAEQVAAIIALACERIDESGIPMSPELLTYG